MRQAHDTTSRRSTLNSREIAEQRNTLSVELDSLLQDENGEDRAEFTEEQETRVEELLGEIRALDERVKDEKKREKRNKRLLEARTALPVAAERDPAGTTTVDEPMVYGEGSPHSWVNDISRMALIPYTGGADPAVLERMSTWAHQAEREFASGSKFGKHAEEQIRNKFRTENGDNARRALDEAEERGRLSIEQKQSMERRGFDGIQSGLETRGITTGSGATASASGGGGAAFVTPWFTTPDYAPYREVGRAFADACNKQPLPPFGK